MARKYPDAMFGGAVGDSQAGGEASQQRAVDAAKKSAETMEKVKNWKDAKDAHQAR